VSSARIILQCFILLLLAGMAMSIPPQQASPAQFFQRGQDALTRGQLDEAERDFREVLQLDPQAGGAYANLGVVYMRQKKWNKALQVLQKAEHLMPQVSGIQLNIGLAYYRQNEFVEATPPFESVVRDEPDALQPRYLLGLCYFFAERWADAATTLAPLWARESGQLAYLYVLSNAAHRAGQKELDNRATEQLIQLGDGSPEYLMFVGKYYLNLEQYDSALTEFRAAAEADPKLPFVHFNLGLTYLKKQDYQRACAEFLADAALEPDLALNYEELGDVYWLTQDDKKAEESYRGALRRDPRLVNSHLGLARIYQRQEKLAPALVEIDAAVKVDPVRPDLHYMRGQVLQHMGRKQEAKKELEAAVSLSNEHRGQGEKQETVPSPELLQDPP
jgi:tetratricopeptide (TPR) repeat protein